jgi:hypothetical protein
MSDLVEILRARTESIGWVFDYGRRDFQNLVETDSENDPKWYFFLDPIRTDTSLMPTKKISTGYFMLLSKSDLDEVYDSQQNVNPDNGKYKKNILPKKTYLENDFKNMLECDGTIEITKAEQSDIINLFDDNFDGVLVNFTITQFL